MPTGYSSGVGSRTGSGTGTFATLGQNSIFRSPHLKPPPEIGENCSLILKARRELGLDVAGSSFVGRVGVGYEGGAELMVCQALFSRDAENHLQAHQ